MIARLAIFFSLLASIVVVITFLTGTKSVPDFFNSSGSQATQPAPQSQPTSSMAPQQHSPAALQPDIPPAPQPTDTPSSSDTTFSPSFVCAADRGTVEQAICHDADLSAKDREMAQLYFQKRKNLVGDDGARFIQSQRDWLAKRNACSDPRLRQCVADLYDSRITELQAYSGN